MGIVNVTPDSFSDGGQRFDPARAVDAGIAMAEQGALVVDVGGVTDRAQRPYTEEAGACCPWWLRFGRGHWSIDEPPT